jgi:uncharacterized membrane protein YqjE
VFKRQQLEGASWQIRRVSTAPIRKSSRLPGRWPRTHGRRANRPWNRSRIARSRRNDRWGAASGSSSTSARATPLPRCGRLQTRCDAPGVSFARKAATRRQNDGRDQSTADLIKQLAHDTTTLVRKELDLARAEAGRAAEVVVTLTRQELSLARAEMAEKGRKAGPGLGMVGGAGVAALPAIGSLTAFLIIALDGAIPNWLAALVVTLAWGVAAAALYYTGKERVQEAGPLVPEQTAETVKEDVEWAKTQIGSEKR